jgi:outer membrane scaffolding protein for murein synthesis (MipA/OmpV family)
LRDVNLNVGSLLTLSPNMNLMLGIHTKRLMGDAKDSPLTRDRNSVGALASLSFKL